MSNENLARLLNEACELLILFEDGNIANEQDKKRIDALFMEIKYADEIDDELALTFSEWQSKKQMMADEQAQDWELFKGKKI